jgi:hypothetical protein
MRRYFRSLALIPRVNEERSSWFCQWNQVDGWFDFVTGERLDNESFRDCIDREVSNTLGLGPKDYLVANMAQLNLEFAAVLPGEAEASHVSVAFFIVNPYGKTSRQMLESHPGGRWLTGGELLEGKTTDGIPVSPVVTYLLKRADVIPSW